MTYRSFFPAGESYIPKSHTNTEAKQLLLLLLVYLFISSHSSGNQNHSNLSSPGAPT
jgi:hypothetical protein